jgi:hypothetical protein
VTFSKVLKQALGQEETPASQPPLITGKEIDLNLSRILMETLFGGHEGQPSPDELVEDPTEDTGKDSAGQNPGAEARGAVPGGDEPVVYVPPGVVPPFSGGG